MGVIFKNLVLPKWDVSPQISCDKGIGISKDGIFYWYKSFVFQDIFVVVNIQIRKHPRSPCIESLKENK